MNFSLPPKLIFPPLDADRVSLGDDGPRIYDIVRRKWVALTPEEWVRQHCVEWLIRHKNFSVYRLANEIGIKFNGMTRRCDTVLFDKSRSVSVIIEYKAPSVPISQKTFDQIVRYNMVLRARYLIVTNGLQLYCCAIDYDADSYSFLKEVPDDI